jgi:hypothetical protein
MGGLLAVAGVAIGAGALLAREVELGRRRASFVGGLVALSRLGARLARLGGRPGRRRPRGRAHARVCGSRGAAVLLVPRRRLDELLLGVLGGAAVVSVTGVVRYALGMRPTDRLELPIATPTRPG